MHFTDKGIGDAITQLSSKFRLFKPFTFDCTKFAYHILKAGGADFICESQLTKVHIRPFCLVNFGRNLKAEVDKHIRSTGNAVITNEPKFPKLTEEQEQWQQSQRASVWLF